MQKLLVLQFLKDQLLVLHPKNYLQQISKQIISHTIFAFLSAIDRVPICFLALKFGVRY